MNFNELQRQEVENLYMMVATNYENLKITPLIFSYRVTEMLENSENKTRIIETLDLEDKEVFYDYYKIISNFSMIKKDIYSIALDTQNVAANISQNFLYDLPIIKAKEQEFKKFGNLFLSLKSMVEEVDNALNAIYKIKDINEWFNRINLYHNRILKIYNESINYIRKELKNDRNIKIQFYKEFLDNYQMIYYFFAEKCDKIMDLKESIIENTEISAKIDNDKIIKFEYKETTERELLIKKVNDMYKELCIDMIDLEKQVPYSARNYYNEFIKMFDNFNKQFKMPLPRNTKFATAKEALAFMNKMLDYITYGIGENSSKTTYEWGNE